MSRPACAEEPILRKRSSKIPRRTAQNVASAELLGGFRDRLEREAHLKLVAVRQAVAAPRMCAAHRLGQAKRPILAPAGETTEAPPDEELKA